MTRLSLALTAALLGLATATTVATADPTSTPPTSTESAPPTSSEPPPTSETPPPATVDLQDLQVTATFDKPSYTTGEKIKASVTATNTGKESLTTNSSFPRRADAITVVPGTNSFRTLTLTAGASVTHTLTGAVDNAEITTAKLYLTFGDKREFAFPVTITQKQERAPEAARPLNSLLGAKMEFTKDSYKRGEAPTVRVTLTNKSDLQLPKIVATCEHGPVYPNLTGKNWGDLSNGGVTVPPRTTKVVEVTEPMPELAPEFGYVRVNCEFSQADVDYGANPTASDEAAFPGRAADLTIGVTTSGAGSPAGFRVVLTKSKNECPVIAETKTGADGKATLKDVPVGRYHLYVVPPTKKWFFKKGNDTGAEAVANRDNGFHFVAWTQTEDNPTLAQPPTCPGGGPGTNPPGNNPPGPQGSTGSGLAYTGASLVVPGLAGLIALLAGIGMLLITQRRRTAS